MGGTRSFLFAHWEGGGNTPPVLAVMRRLVARGHTVRLIGEPCNRPEVEATGASFVSWTRAPHRTDKSPESDPLRDWEVKSPLALMARARDRMFFGPALAYAQDVADALRASPADVVVSGEMLFGAMAGAEAAGVPCVALCANLYFFPMPGVPPFGPGLQPATNVLGRSREWLFRSLTLREFAKGARVFNDARRALGLDPLRHPFDQLDRLVSTLVLTSVAFEYPTARPPARIVYAGPELDDPPWPEPWRSPWPDGDRRPLVLVGFSTTFQDQSGVLRTVTEALGALDVRAVVTTGPAMSADSLPRAANVHVCASAPHSVIMKDAAAVVSHCGHGTVMRALAAGVPIVCMPMGRDQNDNAARVVFHGAGVQLKPSAAAQAIREAIRTVLDRPAYRERARTLGREILKDARESRAVAVLEEIAAARGAVRSVR